MAALSSCGRVGTAHTLGDILVTSHCSLAHADFSDAVLVPRCLGFTCMVVPLLFLFSFYYSCVCILPGWVSLYHMCAVSLEARDVLDPLGLELQPSVTYPWTLAIQPVTSSTATLSSWATTPAEPCCYMSCLSKQEREPVVLRDSGWLFLTYWRALYTLPWSVSEEPEVNHFAGRHRLISCFLSTVSLNSWSQAYKLAHRHTERMRPHTKCVCKWLISQATAIYYRQINQILLYSLSKEIHSETKFVYGF